MTWNPLTPAFGRAFALLGFFTFTGCAADEPSSERALLFDLDRDEIDVAVDAYAPGVDPEILAAQLEAPFSCDRFGDACERLGPQRAEELLEEVWALAREDAPAREIGEAIDASLTAVPVADAAQNSTASICTFFPPNSTFISVSAWKFSIGLFSAGGVSFHSTRQFGVGPAWGNADHPVDATLSLDITTLTGTSLFSGADAVTATAQASYGHIVPGPFFLVYGEVDATGCPVVAASI